LFILIITIIAYYLNLNSMICHPEINHYNTSIHLVFSYFCWNYYLC